jgi:hypothetical protein
MSDELTPENELTPEELEAEGGAELPDREAMSVLSDATTLLGDSGGLLTVDVDLALDADVAAPIDAAVAANANVAAPIDAAVSANVLSVNSTSIASADQDSIIVQELDGVATATAEQDADVNQ